MSHKFYMTYAKVLKNGKRKTILAYEGDSEREALAKAGRYATAVVEEYDQFGKARKIYG